MTKVDIFALFSKFPRPNPSFKEPELAPDAIAIAGTACRFLDANTVEQLWDVISSARSMVLKVPKRRVNFEDNHKVRSDQRWASKIKFYRNFISNYNCFDNSFFHVSSKERGNLLWTRSSVYYSSVLIRPWDIADIYVQVRVETPQTY